MGLIDSARNLFGGGAGDSVTYQCNACMETFVPTDDSTTDLRCPLCSDRNVREL